MKQNRLAKRYLMSAGALLIFVAYLFPVYWMFISGLKPTHEIFRYPPTLWPQEPTLAPFGEAVRLHFFRYLRNSLVISSLTTVFTLVLAAPAAYAIARLQLAWVKWLILAFVIAQLLPPVLMATPMFIMFRQLGLVNNFLSVILAISTLGVSFAIIMLRPVFLEVPVELEEAAFIDGARRLRVFLQVVLPMSRSGIAVVTAISFIFGYQDFIYALSFLTNENLHPTTLGLYNFIGAQAVSWERVMAFASLSCLPLVILFVALQRQILRGLSSGALKS